MTVKDFTAWAVPDLELPLGGRTYVVHPPSVARGREIVACTVRAEHTLGLATGPVPPEMETLLAELAKKPLGHISLGEGVYREMVDAGVPQATIDRMAYYALFFWARGEDRADQIAEFLWTPKSDTAEAGEPSGEAPRR